MRTLLQKYEQTYKVEIRDEQCETMWTSISICRLV